MSKLASILAEIDRKQNKCSKEIFIEQKSINLIAAFNNLKEFISENYNSEDSQDLLGRLLRAMEQNDIEKVTRKINQIKVQEGKKK